MRLGLLKSICVCACLCVLVGPLETGINGACEPSGSMGAGTWDLNSVLRVEQQVL